MRLVWAAVLAVARFGAQAQALVAEYWAKLGSLPPEYAWDLNITFRDDGSVALRRCTGTKPKVRGASWARARFQSRC